MSVSSGNVDFLALNTGGEAAADFWRQTLKANDEAAERLQGTPRDTELKREVKDLKAKDPESVEGMWARFAKPVRIEQKEVKGNENRGCSKRKIGDAEIGDEDNRPKRNHPSSTPVLMVSRQRRPLSVTSVLNRPTTADSLTAPAPESLSIDSRHCGVGEK
ncbi:hypothetical protein QFC22_006094 [Naganishia vaughanmartiniae]|uniref:Uncharacterized protein n=1 Tax=Naganishia vaughanmartiniae TaxID=1424756 RepID=A0ACC2WNK7_9TREE|nr:hypothetical protein QFC22_006094 [Naganishia vaughanmartiniae]